MLNVIIITHRNALFSITKTLYLSHGKFYMKTIVTYCLLLSYHFRTFMRNDKQNSKSLYRGRTKQNIGE